MSVGFQHPLTSALSHLWARCEAGTLPLRPCLGQMGRVCGRGLRLEGCVCVCVCVEVIMGCEA